MFTPLPEAGRSPDDATVPSTQTNSNKHALFRWMSNVRLGATPWPPSAKRHVVAPVLGLALVVSTGLLACGTASPAQQPTSESTAATRQADEPSPGSATANPSGTTRGQDGDAAGKPPSNSTTTGGTSARQSRLTPASDASTANATTGGEPEGTSLQKPSGPEVDALTALYRATDGDNWKSNTNWLSDQPVDTWQGVWVNDAGRVRTLNLNNNQLAGHLPPELGKLEELTDLNVAGNQLSGQIPEEFSSLPLDILDLSRNQLSGPIPTGVIELAAQGVRLNLSENAELCLPAPEHRLADALQKHSSVSGRPRTCEVDPATVERDREILVAFYKATGGDTWTAAENWLSPQPLDTWLGVRTDASGRVSSLWLPENGLTGPIPQEIMQLAHLISLGLRDNALTGEIPPNIDELTYLQSLSLGNTQLTGTIPESIGNLRYLEGLSLRKNQLTGEVPRSLGNLRYLESVSLSENQLTGTVPPELGNLAPDHDRGYRGLESLDLSKNELTGDIPRELTRLQGEINLWGNPITGCLPDEWEARVTVDLYPCSRGANDNPESWLKLVAVKDEYGNDLYPEPIIVREIKQQILAGLMPHLVEWARAEHPDSAGHYSEDNLRTIIYSRLQHELEWEPLWSQAPDLKIRINGQFEWDTREDPVQYQMTAVGVLETVETSKRDWTQEYIENYERVPAFSRVEGTPKVEKVNQ